MPKSLHDEQLDVCDALNDDKTAGTTKNFQILYNLNLFEIVVLSVLIVSGPLGEDVVPLPARRLLGGYEIQIALHNCS